MKTPIKGGFQPMLNTTMLYLFFGLSVFKSPVGEGPHLFKLLFLSFQHLAQVYNHLREDRSHNKLVSLENRQKCEM